MTDRLPEPAREPPRASDHAAERASASPTRARHLGAHRETGDNARASPPGRDAGGIEGGLRRLEEWMVGAILSAADPGDVGAIFTAGPRQTPGERFDIYRFGYRARLVECLADDYPVLAETLGQDPFERLASAYIDRYPSASPNLNAFGRYLPSFCREWGADVGVRAAFSSELAALEWAIVEAIHAEGGAPFDAARLQGLRPEEWNEIRFEPSRAVRVLKFEYPVNAYYQARRVGTAPSVPGASASATAVYRKDLTVWRMDLTPAMTRVLESLLHRAPLGEALARIVVDEADEEALKEAERSVMIWFREWVSSGFFRDVIRSPEM